MKVLIGITPQGSICFTSKAWGGWTSDKYLTERCGLLNNLKAGDLVLADRGFTISESVALYQAQLAIPAFTKGKNQLDQFDVERTQGNRKCANTRGACHWTFEAKIYYLANNSTIGLPHLF